MNKIMFNGKIFLVLSAILLFITPDLFSQLVSGKIQKVNALIDRSTNPPCPTSLNWTGGASSAWDDSINWGGICFPGCTVGAVIISGSAYQPVVDSIQQVDDVFINAGSALTILAGARLQVCGNFTNYGALLCDSNSTVEFIGTTNQIISGNLSGGNEFGNLIINNNGGSVIQQTTVDVKGILTLNNGVIITNNNDLRVINPTPSAVDTGKVNSYVQGNLQRSFAAGITGAFEFPVGNALHGFERATINFITAPSSSFVLRSRFLDWGGGNLPLTSGPFPPLDCFNINWSLVPALDHGYWNFTSITSVPSGMYYITLYNRNYLNGCAPLVTVMEDSASNGIWGLRGACFFNAGCISIRTSLDASSTISNFATAQADTFNNSVSGLNLEHNFIFKIHNNPSSGAINLSWNSDRPFVYQVKIFDLIGKILFQQSLNSDAGNNSKEIDLRLLAKGMYFLNIESDNSSSRTIKFILE